MPRLTKAVPRYLKHKPSGQARVVISGEEIWLGKYNSPASLKLYDQLIAAWLAGGRHLDLEKLPQGASVADSAPETPLTVEQLAKQYIQHAAQYYRKGGKITREAELVREALTFACDLYGRTPAEQFGPKRLDKVRQRMIKQGWTRKHINKQIGRIKRAFTWAVEKELIRAAEKYQALLALRGLHKGRTAAPDRAPVPPVPDHTVQQTLPHLPAVVADMVRFQRLTGCRPAEVCALTPGAIDRSGEVWIATMVEHKTEHHGKQRFVPIGPQAQAVLKPYLLRGADQPCFSPQDSEKQRRRRQHEGRQTPLSCGNKPGSNRKAKPCRKAGTHYTTDSYRRAIHRACDLAFPAPPPLAQHPDETRRQWRERLTSEQHEKLKRWQTEHRWSPNQLRHTAGTEVRRKFGLEAAQVVLGHASANITQVYAERDLQLAVQVAKQVG